LIPLTIKKQISKNLYKKDENRFDLLQRSISLEIFFFLPPDFIQNLFVCLFHNVSEFYSNGVILKLQKQKLESIILIEKNKIFIKVWKSDENSKFFSFNLINDIIYFISNILLKYQNLKFEIKIIFKNKDGKEFKKRN
jgi:hypothetical protein